MPVLSTSQAVEFLANQVSESLMFQELLKVQEDLFVEEPSGDTSTLKDHVHIAGEIVDYLKSDLTPEEVVAAWKLIVQKTRNVWYEERDGKIHYNEDRPNA